MKSFQTVLRLCVLMIASFSIGLHAGGQVDTARLKREQQQQLEKIKKAQQDALKQLKDMGIDIDPNEKMSKEKAQELKDKLLKQGEKKIPAIAKKHYQHTNIDISKIPTEKQVVQIAERFYDRSYKKLNAVERACFEKDLTEARKDGFDNASAKAMASKGASFIGFGNNHHIACVYLAGAVRSRPSDTLSVNNFGGYLRIIDSLKPALTVLLYANSLFSESPVILTQIGCTLLELNDDVKAEKYLKEALEYNPDFGQAQTALCEVYIRQKKLTEAIRQLFAGVRNMGASYSQGTNALHRIEEAYRDEGKQQQSKEDFRNEMSHLQSSGQDASMPMKGMVRMPSFPVCAKVEDWTMGGGYEHALQSYYAFFNYTVAFAQQVQALQTEPASPPNVFVRSYGNERLALDCIKKMFLESSEKQKKAYSKEIDGILHPIGEAIQKYQQQWKANMDSYLACVGGCPAKDDACRKKCLAEFCKKDCPAIEEYNRFLQSVYNQYQSAFNRHVQKQTQLLDDFYAFANPWLSRIQSEYWGKRYAYEVKNVALSIVNDTYVFYAQGMGLTIEGLCGKSCALLAELFAQEPDKVNQDDPEGGKCPSSLKFKVPMVICEAGFTCESVELECSAVISASIEKNFKKDEVTMFVGVGAKSNLGVFEADAKAGMQMTVNSRNEVVDVGFKAEAGLTLGGPINMGLKGNATVTVMQGFDAGLGGEFGF